MEEYKKNCPEVYEQIVIGVQEQRAHRISLEAEQSRRILKTQEQSERNQSLLSYAALLGAILIPLAELWFTGQINHWIIPVVFAVSAVGGKPVATIIAEIISKFGNR